MTHEMNHDITNQMRAKTLPRKLSTFRIHFISDLGNATLESTGQKEILKLTCSSKKSFKLLEQRYFSKITHFSMKTFMRWGKDHFFRSHSLFQVEFSWSGTTALEFGGKFHNFLATICLQFHKVL